MSLFYLRPSPSEEPEIIISVSKKVAKKAVTRNLIKRRVRAVLRKIKEKPKSFMLIAKPGAEEVKGEVLEAELKNLFKI